MVYTDGSTHMSNSFAFARSGCGVYYAEQHPFNTAAPLLADMHTTVRAELRAIVHVLRTADFPVLIHSDCKSVVDVCHKCQQGIPPDPKHPDADISEMAYQFLQQAGPKFFDINWMPAHLLELSNAKKLAKF